MQNGQNQNQMQQNQQVQKQQMTEEELQRTQVLNFDDFKQVARFEKISSKKPALIVALIGVLALIIGGSYPIVQSQMAKNKDESNKSTVQARKKDVKEDKTELTCTRSKMAPTSVTGLNEIITIKYIFENDKLTSFTKELSLTIPEGSTTGESLIQNYLTALEPYLVQLDGYKISVKQVDKGVLTTTAVDYQSLDVTKVPEINQQNEYFNIIYIAGTNKTAISQDMATQEYQCS